MAKIAQPSAKSYPHLTILEDISTLISHSRDLQQTLNSIVATVAERMGMEISKRASSWYVRDPSHDSIDRDHWSCLIKGKKTDFENTFAETASRSNNSDMARPIHR